MRTLAALLILSLPICALAQLQPQTQTPMNLPWPTEAAGQPFAGPMGAYLQGPQLSALTPNAAPLSPTSGALSAPAPASSGFMGLSQAASDAVTLGWGPASPWGASTGLSAPGTASSAWSPNPVWGAQQQQPLANADLSAARWSAAGLNPWLPAASASSPVADNPWTAAAASPWLGGAGAGPLGGVTDSSAAGLPASDFTGGASAWLSAPASAGLSPVLPSNAGLGWNAAPGALSIGAGSLTLSPNPWLAAEPLMGAAPATQQATPDLGSAPNPWTPLGSPAAGLSGLQPQSPAPATTTWGLTPQPAVPAFAQPGAVPASPWATPALPDLTALPPATTGSAAQPGPVWQTAPQNPTPAGAWGSANPVLTLDGQSWQVVAPSALPDGTPANTQSLMDQAREAGFTLTPIDPQAGAANALEPPAMP